MQKIDSSLCFSATDLVHFIDCEHLTALDLCGLSDGEFRPTKVKQVESAELIARKGTEHLAKRQQSMVAPDIEGGLW
ncbi:hypothetical protein LNV09_20645 [Paucibacter sp. B2R-40]|uniref:hypothetical protein n=1 Tax=Paucibacter sp. B2R-40 TaxID=2893554 RepID=UPI0021E37D81|nr:hypothetical protein [Paucibacter sp. B2R-40]MCV2356557.1 hypothetical protein [Paucibacter sp. B2R-40]